ncbi:MAG: sll0787 family AIR synthase-like protein [Synechococcales cyanobacterium T60_A2020_003]|nr:sll0787 family AIR synthase-like protein [Synechococcales cyanobacterium T60_A2020_003]
MLHKKDIQAAARYLNPALGLNPCNVDPSVILLGDDCAAIPDHGGYLLLAAEGLLPQFLDTDPWFAGWCAVMVNVSDVYAMGGRAIAVVDTIWSASDDITKPIFEGMQAAAIAYGIPIVGGHTNTHSPYTALSVAILGRANRLISSFNAQPGDVLMMVTDFRGASHPRYSFWNAATTADPAQLRDCLSLLPMIAESGLCDAGKDISMGGLVGTLIMLLETSGCGATLHLDQIPCPPDLALEKWLLCFPSYGFVLSLRPEHTHAVQTRFRGKGLVCEAVGIVENGSMLQLESGGESVDFWDPVQRPLTGFGRSPLSQPSQTILSTPSL